MTSIKNRLTKITLLCAVALLTFSGAAEAQYARGRVGVFVSPRWNFGFHGFYDPFWLPSYPYGWYPYVVEHPSTAVRVDVVPKHVDVFIDGYLAGTGGKIRTIPGGHAVTLFAPGYRTITREIYVAPDSTFKMQATMEKLGAGEVSSPPPPAGRPSQSERPSAQPPASTPQ